MICSFFVLAQNQKPHMIKAKIGKLFSDTQVRNLMVYGVGQGVNLISPLLVIPYVVSVCGEEGFGKISIGFSMAFILIVLVDFGSYINGVKEVAINRENPRQLESVFVTTYAAKLVLLLFVTAVSLIIIFLRAVFLP
jgi:O-antigen/teichoic acid export membrane protein